MRRRGATAGATGPRYVTSSASSSVRPISGRGKARPSRRSRTSSLRRGSRSAIAVRSAPVRVTSSHSTAKAWAAAIALGQLEGHPRDGLPAVVDGQAGQDPPLEQRQLVAQRALDDLRAGVGSTGADRPLDVGRVLDVGEDGQGGVDGRRVPPLVAGGRAERTQRPQHVQPDVAVGS